MSNVLTREVIAAAVKALDVEPTMHTCEFCGHTWAERYPEMLLGSVRYCPVEPCVWPRIAAAAGVKP